MIEEKQPRDSKGRFMTWTVSRKTFTRDQMRQAYQAGMSCGSIMSPQKQFDLFMRKHDK